MIEFVTQEDELKEIYVALLKPRQKHDVLVRQLEEMDAGDIVKKVGMMAPEFEPLSLGRLPLDKPFSYIEIGLESNGVSYRGETNISLPFGFPKREELREQAVSKLTSSGKALQMGDGLVFLGADRTILFSALYDSIFFFPMIKFGGQGTAKRRLDNFEQFEADMNCFARVLTDVVNAGYEKETPNVRFRINL
jgi:hypothetical protein